MWNTKGVGVDGSSDKEAEGDAVPAVMLHADQDLGTSSLTARTLLLSINYMYTFNTLITFCGV
jgi:hypothetical protein